MTPIFNKNKIIKNNSHLNGNSSNKISNSSNKISNIINEYMNNITDKCFQKIQFCSKNQQKNVTILTPTIYNYNDVLAYDYTIPQLKGFAKELNIKMGGKKIEILKRIYSHLHFFLNITKVQKLVRGCIARKYKELHGPASVNRKLCNNRNDFITLEPVEEINFHQFFSYKDTDGFIYGFNIISLYNLFLKSDDFKKMQNPYNRNNIPYSILKTIKKIIRLSIMLCIPIQLHFEDDTENLSIEKTIELRALSVFQKIDSLGNYSNSEWFLTLNKIQLIKFVKELYEIWSFRSQITNDVKHKICPLGDPFRYVSMAYIHSETNILNIKKVILTVLENLVNTGVDKDSQTLGAYYILGALTLVNDSAAISLPWLFQSFGYF